MKKIFFTLAGTKHYYGSEFFKPEMRVELEKEEDNEGDTEAIVVKMKRLGKVWIYLPNSPYTVLGRKKYEWEDYMTKSRKRLLEKLC